MKTMNRYLVGSHGRLATVRDCQSELLYVVIYHEPERQYELSVYRRIEDRPLLVETWPARETPLRSRKGWNHQELLSLVAHYPVEGV